MISAILVRQDQLGSEETMPFHPVDAHVGGRLRLRRKLLGFNQTKLGDAVNLTFQQIQKYERGTNRMGASRLFQFSQILGVPISFFFEDMPADIGEHVPEVEMLADNRFQETGIPEEEVNALVVDYNRIKDRKARHRLRDLARGFAGIKRGRAKNKSG
ncbi:MAG: transcriptional regulator [Rhodospirillaceae bacterium]|jgi:transcriptional regulator with XRE-family HTH domain|nr:transcriptional regulator [Rhodospirillaceae bacterium]|tara:strand:- start:173 stop:646 length:474 start_codon:yes stop_codon:yes gene_type:complete